MNEKEIIERAKTLLKAYVDMFDKQHESPIIKDITELTTFYDGCECDGTWLRDDMEILLDDIECWEDKE